jgi:hypothetical protein
MGELFDENCFCYLLLFKRILIRVVKILFNSERPAALAVHRIINHGLRNIKTIHPKINSYYNFKAVIC